MQSLSWSWGGILALKGLMEMEWQYNKTFLCSFPISRGESFSEKIKMGVIHLQVSLPLPLIRFDYIIVVWIFLFRSFIHMPY